MQCRLVAFLILVTGAGALVQAHPAPSKPALDATGPSAEVRKQKYHAAAIADCEAMWDRGTHMIRKEWSRAYRRVQERLKQLELK
jgi:hypothetical protein